MEEKVNLQFNLNANNFQILENDDYCSIAEIDFLHLGLNRNQCNITEDCVKKSLSSFYNKPLLCILDNSVIPQLSEDFKEHARSIDEKNKMIAFGTIPESSEFQFIKRDNGKIYLNAKVVIWKRYFPLIVNILKKREGNVKVSIELKVISGDQDKDSGILDIYEFKLLSCVLLGEEVMEGIEGSHLEMLRFSLDSGILEESNKHYLQFSYKNEKHSVPEELLNSIKLEINNCKKEGKGYTNTDLELAKKIVNNKYIENRDIEKFNKSIFNKNEIKDWLGDIEERGVVLLNSLSNNELQEQIWRDLEQYKYRDGDWEGRKYYVEEIYSDEKIAIVRDNETAEYYKVPYEITDGKVSVKMNEKKEVHRSYEEKKVFSAFTSVVFAKKDYGTGKSIKVDKSKEAMSDSSWGSINKTELRKKVLEAKNYKTLVKDVYALVEEGWEEAPSSKLKYPIMEIKNSEAVYNRYGLASALAYAEKENETAVINKVKSLYKKLDIKNEDEGGEKKMAKELDKDEKVVENKVDKDNKDIEKIKDDADAQEDDVKEKEKKNTVEKVNKIEKDDKGEEGLEDDVDADKDYWKKKANALEIKNAEIEGELKKYKRAEEEKEMAAEIDKFAHCMSEDEVEGLKNAIKECSCEEMKNKIDEKVRGFALKAKESKKEKKEEMKYSVNPMFDLDTMSFSKEAAQSLDDVINNSVAEIGK